MAINKNPIPVPFMIHDARFFRVIAWHGHNSLPRMTQWAQWLVSSECVTKPEKTCCIVRCAMHTPTSKSPTWAQLLHPAAVSPSFWGRQTLMKLQPIPHCCPAAKKHPNCKLCLGEFPGDYKQVSHQPHFLMPVCLTDYAQICQILKRTIPPSKISYICC